MTAVAPARVARPRVAPVPAGLSLDRDDSRITGILRRLWQLPLTVHAVVLLALLAGVAVLVGTQASWLSDEGAAIIQVHALVNHHSWTVPHPFPQVDPGGQAYPLALAASGTAGLAPFGKHLTYILLLAVANQVAGVAGMVGLSVLAAAAAALLAARLSAAIRPGLERVTLWTVGLASPLLFDSNLVIAHTLGAALVAAAVLLALRTLRGGRMAALVPMGACLVTAVLLRTEAALLCGALGFACAALALVGWRSRRASFAAPEPWSGRRPKDVPAPGRPILTGAVVLVAGLLARELDITLTRAAVGPARQSVGAAATVKGGHGILAHLATFLMSWVTPGKVLGRLHALVLTWFDPSYQLTNHWSVLLMVTLVAGAVGAVAVRRRPGDVGGIILITAMGVAAVLARLVGDPSGTVPGLVVAFPVLWVGLWLIRPALLESLPAFVLTVTAAVFALGVVLLQYPDGGGAEWGGRYFAISLPLIVPVALEAIRRAGAGLGRAARRATLAGLIIVSAVLGLTAVIQLRLTHQSTAQLTALTTAAGQATVAGQPGQRPVIVTTQGQLPRFAWKTFDDQRWLLVPQHVLATYGRRLRHAGIQRFVLVTATPKRQLADLSGNYREVSSQHPSLSPGFTVAVLRARKG